MKKKIAKLTRAESKAWGTEFQWAKVANKYGDQRADAYAWRCLVKRFPRLKAFDGCR